jgi:SAM-dependent methyltransferase
MTGVAGPRDFLEWDVRNWSVALDFWTRHGTRPLDGARALEVGSRHGGLSLWLALQGARVVCSDVGPPSARAVRKHRAAGLSHRISYQAVDATRMPYRSAFDVVVFKSVLGAIGRGGGLPAQERAILEMHRALRPGGELLFAENLIASPVHQFLRRRFVGWSSWRYVSVDEMRAVLAPFAHVAYCTVGFAGVFGRTGRQRHMLGSLDRAWLDGVVPERWRYVIAGIARK